MSSLHGHHFVVLIVSLIILDVSQIIRTDFLESLVLCPFTPLSPCLTHILMQKLNKNINCDINDHIQGQYYYLR